MQETHIRETEREKYHIALVFSRKGIRNNSRKDQFQKPLTSKAVLSSLSSVILKDEMGKILNHLGIPILTLPTGFVPVAAFETKPLTSIPHWIIVAPMINVNPDELYPCFFRKAMRNAKPTNNMI